MSFVADFVEAVIDIVVAVVEIVIQVVEVIFEFLIGLLGYEETTQTIEYFEVENVSLFDKEDIEGGSPLLNLLLRSVSLEQDIAGEMLFASTFRNQKKNFKKFMSFIEDENYIVGFPQIESLITFPDYDELTTVLTTLNGAACTVENSFTRALDKETWVKSWLQDNSGYSIESNTIGSGSASTSTSPASTSDGSSVTYDSPSATFNLDLIDEVATSDAVLVDQAWFLDISTIVYNSGPDNYSVDIYNAAGTYVTLGYTIPSRPTGLHYTAYYYIDSVPAVTYLFTYKVGDGTYPTLDSPESEIDIDATNLQVVPAIPLRISNVDYTSSGAITSVFPVQVGTAITITIKEEVLLDDEPTINAVSNGITSSVPAKVTKINELCKIIALDAPDILDAVKNDPSAPSAGDLDHIYINFGVKLFDISQPGLSYMFTACENLFPSQGVTQGIYDATAAGDTKPANNIIITTGDYKYVFQFSYISFEFTTLAAIDADSGSDENGFYYSDLSKFKDGILEYPYYVSSGKGTYNVGYKADNLTEVSDFLLGSGTVNPGTTTTEAADWLQVTTRLAYNNPTPVLLDPDNTTSDLVFLTGDLVYEDNGSGVLRLVQQASEETTAGQSITYYRAITSGLAAYTLKAPIGSLRVEDGDSGAFRMVKFNLGNRDDVMFPFIHTFIKDFSIADVTKLFLAGAHISIYVARYEVIVNRPSKWLFLLMIVLIIILIVITVVTFGTAAPYTSTAGTAIIGGVETAVVVSSTGAVTVASTGAAVAVGTTVTTTAAFTGIVSTGVVAAGVGGVTTVALSVAWVPTFIGWATTFATQQILSYAIGAIGKSNPELAMVLSVASVFTLNTTSISSVGGSYTLTYTAPGFLDVATMFATTSYHASMLVDIYVEGELAELTGEYNESKAAQNTALAELQKDIDVLTELQKDLFANSDGNYLTNIGQSTLRVRSINQMFASISILAYEHTFDLQYSQYEQTSVIERSIDGSSSLYG